MTELPLDVWLIVFGHSSDHDTLWSIVRNVSRHLRICVDEYFRHAVLPDTVIDLVYSTIHSESGPSYRHLHGPMLFARLSEDGTRAVFRQAVFKNEVPFAIGSVRGWVPFIERYRRETKKPAPTVLNKTPSAKGKPLWEQEHQHWCRTQAKTFRWDGSEYLQYLRTLRDHTSIGRGDRPPYFIKLPNYTQDTELVDLALDCSAREISIDWRRTFSAFFIESHFTVLADQRPSAPKPEYDERLVQVLGKVNFISKYDPFDDLRGDNYCRARRKRLREWVAANRKRMSAEHRLITEYNIDHMRWFEVGERFRRDELVAMQDSDVDAHEIVPNKCAEDHEALIKWPRGRRDWNAIRMENKERGRRCTRGCVVL
jgi:hypothetical protein